MPAANKAKLARSIVQTISSAQAADRAEGEEISEKAPEAREHIRQDSDRFAKIKRAAVDIAKGGPGPVGPMSPAPPSRSPLTVRAAQPKVGPMTREIPGTLREDFRTPFKDAYGRTVDTPHYNPEANRISIPNPKLNETTYARLARAVTAQGRYPSVPRPAEMAKRVREHEVGHMVWQNAMSPEDRDAFRRSYDDMMTARRTGSKSLNDPKSPLYRLAQDEKTYGFSDDDVTAIRDEAAKKKDNRLDLVTNENHSMVNEAYADKPRKNPFRAFRTP